MPQQPGALRVTEPDPFEDSPEAQAAQQEQVREAKLLQSLRREFDWYKREREAVMDPIWDECYRLYRAQAPDVRKSGDWRSRIHVPYAFTNVEDAVPHLMAGIFDAEKPFRVFSKLRPELAEAHERYALHEWNENMDMERKWEEVQKMKVIFGSAPIFVGFKAQFSKRKMWENRQSPLDPNLQAPVIREHLMPDYVGNFVEPIHLYNVYVHPRATHDNQRGVFWLQYRTRDWLIKSARFKNLERLTDAMRHTSSGSSGAAGQEQAEFFGEMRSSFPEAGGEDSTVPEFRIVTKYDEESRQVFTMAGPEGAEILIEEGDFPLWHGKIPILWDFYTPVPKEFYAMGAIEPGISIMHEGNMIRNQRRDNVTLAMNLGFEIRENDIDDEEAELVSKPGFIAHSRTGNAIRPIEYPDVTREAIREAGIVDNDIRNISGLGGPLSGQTDPNSPSGTKFSLQQKGQLMRLSRAIKRQALVIKRLVTQMISNTEQFYPVPQVRAVIGPILFQEIGQVPPVLVPLSGFVQVQPVGVFANDDVLRQQFTNMMNIFTNNPLMIDMINQEEVLRAGLKMFPQLPDVERFFKKRPVHDIAQHRLAFQENVQMAKGRQAPPPDLSDDFEIHVQHHENLLQDRPDLEPVVNQHLLMHRQLEQQRQVMMMQAMTGGGGAGQGGGILNPARQAAPTTQEGVVRSAARGMGRTGA